MFYSVLIYIISAIFFSGSFFNFPDFNYGHIVSAESSHYFQDKKVVLNYDGISASSFAVLNVKNNSWVLEKDSEHILPIASISKLMSLLVLLNHPDIDLEDYYTMKSEDRRVGGRDYIFPGDQVKIKDLFSLALLASDNTAVIALASYLDLSEDDLVNLMNQEVLSRGLEATSFVDATGLDSGNVSTAKETAKLIEEFYRQVDSGSLDFLNRYDYSIITKQGKSINMVSTNLLLNGQGDDNLTIIGGKTGHNGQSGFCLGNWVSLNNLDFIIIVLNSSTLDNRFKDTKILIDHLKYLYDI